jgi:hypothetical protein
MTPEECEELEKHVSQLRNQYNDMGDNVLKKVDLAHSQEILKREIEDKIENLIDLKTQKLMDQKME